MKLQPFWFDQSERVRFKLYSKSKLTFTWKEGIVNYCIQKSPTDKCYIIQLDAGGTVSFNEDQLTHIANEGCSHCMYAGRSKRGVICYHPDGYYSFDCIQKDGSRSLYTKEIQEEI